MTWEPGEDQLIVELLLPANETRGGVVIPQAAQARSQKGIVIAVGPRGRDGPPAWTPNVPRFAPGDLVAFGRYAGIDVELDGDTRLLLRTVEIHARKPAGTFQLVRHASGQHEDHL